VLQDGSIIPQKVNRVQGEVTSGREDYENEVMVEDCSFIDMTISYVKVRSYREKGRKYKIYAIDLISPMHARQQSIHTQTKKEYNSLPHAS
jgi:hypothetical protein